MKWTKIFPVVTFAVSFAFVEAVVVVYLRHLLGNVFPPEISRQELFLTLPGIIFLKPQVAVSIFGSHTLLVVEQAREAATIMMLASVAWIAGKSKLAKLSYFLLVFGLWDIFYYVFLNLTIGWPRSLSDIDVLFLLPVPWIAPVLVPVVISSLMILVALAALFKEKG